MEDLSFTLVTTNVVGFESAMTETGEVVLDDKTLQTEKVRTSETGTSGLSFADSASQTDPIAMKKLSAGEEEKLAAWLRKILPAVEEELQAGVTPMPKDVTESRLVVTPHSVINAEATFLAKGDLVDRGSATWLSLSTVDAPVLALCVSASAHTSWCNHSAQVSLWRPFRQQDRLQWRSIQNIPVKACIEKLAVNPFDRDIFGGGTVTGDFYIWRYLHSENEPVEEMFADSTQFGGVVGLEFQPLPSQGDFVCLSCHNDGHIVQWKLASASSKVVKDKTMRAVNVGRRETLALTTMCSINTTEFVLGTKNGLLLRCSTLQPRVRDDFLDPVNETFGRQTFSIATLQIVDGKSLVSCDSSSEVHIYDISGASTTLRTIIKMPLPLNQRIACYNLDYILGASFNGELMVLRTNGSELKQLENSLRGAGSCIEISRNRRWAVTGSYEGRFQIYRLEEEN